MELIRSAKEVTEGYRCGECDTCDWADYCFSLWQKNESVCLLYGVTGQTTKRFVASEFSSWRAVAKSNPTKLAVALKISPDKARLYWLHASAWAKGRPEIIKVPTFKSDVPIHFYDIETYGNTVYLHGDIRIFKGKRDVKQFLAKDPSQEKEAWHEYLDYLARDKRALIFCWADYERGFANSLWEKYGGNKKGWGHLKKNLVDQCKFVKNHFALPVYSYGIKNVAPVFGFSWKDEDAGGLNSEAWYKEWLETSNQKVLKKILQYNLDDILAMEIIDRRLRELIK